MAVEAEMTQDMRTQAQRKAQKEASQPVSESYIKMLENAGVSPEVIKAIRNRNRVVVKQKRVRRRTA